MRNGSLLFLSAAITVLSSSVCQAAPEVVSVDMQRIMVESKPGKQAAEHLKQVQQVLQKGFDALREKHAKAPEAERNKIYAEGLAVLNRQMDVERQAATQAVHVVVVEEIEKRRRKNGVLPVIPRNVVITGDFNKADYTNTILSAVNRRTVKFAELPRVTPSRTRKNRGCALVRSVSALPGAADSGRTAS